uniref:Protein kinase domain-containing protein n=1 Tax=Caenorhabditis tropicalis TaxID=1561998 RepID=A0A1I7TU22_9PELO
MKFLSSPKFISSSISQSRTSTSSATTSFVSPSNLITNTNATTTTASTSSEPPASAPPNIEIAVYHRMVPSKSKFRQCDVCSRYFFFDLLKRHNCEDVYSCSVCGKRVHEGCLDQLKNDCKLTTQYVGGIIKSAIIKSNNEIWEKPASRPVTPPQLEQEEEGAGGGETLTTTTPQVLERNVHTRSTTPTPLMTMTTSTLDDVTMYSETMDAEDVDYETMLMTWEDVTIQMSDVHVKGRIGDGRFGNVHFAEYHGDAAVKFVNMSYVREESQRALAFTEEIVTAYKNSRHDHIALFYGYVADPETHTYAIVTNFYQHKTLYHRIHESSEDFEQSWIFQISLQICQAMSYLHKKKILHRDLRSKNILLDNPNRVVVTDFALMKLERLAHPKRDYTFCVPNHWLDYLAPELASNLMLDERGDVAFHLDLPFSGESDVYSFGTIFFELLLRKMPTGYDSWEQKLFAKMCGQKAALVRLDTQLQKIDSKLYDLLTSCWSNHPEKRPNFPQIVKRITAMIPRKESNKQKRRSTAHENPLF